MRIYHYEDLKDCHIYGSIGGNIEKFISNIIDNLNDTSDYKAPIHPKEIERQERIKRRQEAENNMPHPRFPRGLDSTFKLKMGQLRSSENKLSKCAVIVNGNCGFGTKDIKYHSDKFEKLNELLGKNEVHILFVRGNLDDPQIFENEVFSLSNIKVIPDYSVLLFEHFNCLCIGGSISIDREWKKAQGERMNKKLYWEDEGFQYKENELNEILDKYNITCVVTNVCPSFSFPGTNVFNKSTWAAKDKVVLADILSERKLMDKVYDKFLEKDKKPYLWVYSAYLKQHTKINNDICFYSCSKFFKLSLKDAIYENFGIKLDGNTTTNKLPIDKLIDDIQSVYKRNIVLDEPFEIVDEVGNVDIEEHEEDNYEWDVELPQAVNDHYNIINNGQNIFYNGGRIPQEVNNVAVADGQIEAGPF